jgi:hypothetical protein
MANSKPHPGVWPIVVFSAVSVVMVCFLGKFLITEVSTALVTAITVLAGLLVISPRVMEIVELTISSAGLTAKLRELEDKVAAAEQAVQGAQRQLHQLVASTLSEPMFEKLRNLASAQVVTFGTDEASQRELRLLRNGGYITLQEPGGHLRVEAARMELTPAGRQLVALREALNPQ